MSSLAFIRSEGFEVIPFGAAFRVSPSDKLTDKHRAFLKIHKSEIIADLQNHIKTDTPTTLIVICYSPNGAAFEVEATSKDHAEKLRLWNPKTNNTGASQ